MTLHALLDSAMAWMLANGPLTLMAIGGLIILGAVLGWRWLCDPSGDRPMALSRLIYHMFGEMGVRIFVGLTGGLVLCFGTVLQFGGLLDLF